MAPESGTRRRDPVGRVFEILRTMIEVGDPSYGVRELATHAGIPASTTHRLLGALEDSGMVMRDPDGAYSVSLEFQRLALRAAELLPLRRAAFEALEALRRRCDETVLLCVYDSSRQRMMFAEALETTDPLRYAIQLNTWVPIHAGASGRSIMAFLPDEEIDELLDDGPLSAITARTIIDGEGLRAALAAGRERGFVVSHGERILDAVGIGAPVFDARERVVGSVCVTMPEFRFRHHDEDALGALVVDAAQRISIGLGRTR